MDQIGWIRRLKGLDGKSERASARMTGLSRNTVAKWLRADVQPPKYRRPAVSCKLTPIEEQLTQALRADARRPEAERRTARRLFAELQAVGYGGSYSRLTDFISAWRLREGQTAATAFVPLAFEWGEAFQFNGMDAHNRCFAALGGVARHGIYDYMKTAVDRVRKGKGREVSGFDDPISTPWASRGSAACNAWT
jgi:transposase